MAQVSINSSVNNVCGDGWCSQQKWIISALADSVLEVRGKTTDEEVKSVEPSNNNLNQDKTQQLDKEKSLQSSDKKVIDDSQQEEE